jgi:hypothetical protein
VALTADQYDFITCMVSGDSLAESALLVGVHRGTAWRWWKSEEVQVEYRRQCETARDLAIGQLQGIGGKAIKALDGLLECDDLKVRRAAAADLLRSFFAGNAQSDFNEARKLLEQLRREREHAGDAEGGGAAAGDEPPAPLPPDAVSP